MATFCRRLRQFNIEHIKKETPIEEVKYAVKKELNGPGKRLGYRAMNRKLRMEHEVKGCVLYILASLFFIFKREHL